MEVAVVGNRIRTSLARWRFVILHCVVVACIVTPRSTPDPRVLTAASQENNWPGFRGSNSASIADDPRLPERWSATDNVAWKVDVPGLGWSSPIVWDEFVFVTAVISNDPVPVPGQDLIVDGRAPGYRGGNVRAPQGLHRWVLYAIDFGTGAIRWQRELHRGLPQEARHPKNTYASETPVTDGKRVYVYHASAGLFAVDFNGQVAWSRTIRLPDVESDVRLKPSVVDDRRTLSDLTAMFSGSGTASSPALDSDRLFITADYLRRTWFMAAYSTQDGRELWRVERPKQEFASGWSSPFVWSNELRTEVIAAGDHHVRSFTVDGRQLWELKGLSVNTTPTPAAADGLLYVTSGYPGTSFRPVYAVRPGASGDISLKEGQSSNRYVVWHQSSAAAYLTSPLVYRGVLYNLYSQGLLTAHNAASGEVIYGRRRIDVEANGFTASPWAYNGKLFALSEDGDTYVIQAGPEYKRLYKNSLAEMVLATPAVTRGSVIIRTATRVYRIARSGT